jgi:predicted RNA-binding protein YlxR (DUF448 family)
VAATPTRTCVGCRARAPKPELVRVVVVDDAAVVDRDGRLPGRGAYVHPVPACAEAATRPGVLVRALRSDRVRDGMGRLRLELERMGAA